MTSPNTSSPPAEYASSSNDTTTSPSLGSSSSSSSLASSSSSSVASSYSSSSIVASAKASLSGAISSVRSGANIVKVTVESVLPKLSLAHTSEGEEVAELMMQIQQQEKRTTAEANEFRKVIREKEDIIEEREKEIDRLSKENKRLFRESYEWKEKCSTDSKRIDQLETQLALANTNLVQSQSMIMQREREIMELQNKLIDMAQRNVSSSLISTVSSYPMSHPPRHQPTDDTTDDTTNGHTNAPTSNITSSGLSGEDLAAMAEEYEMKKIYASCGLTYPPTNCKPATAPKPEDGQTLDDIYADLDDGRGVVVIEPPMTYEGALAHHRDEVEKARSEGRPEPTPPTVRPPRHGPEWVKGMLAMVIGSGYKVAPPDYPVLAAYTTIPSIGLALIPGDD